MLKSVRQKLTSSINSIELENSKLIVKLLARSYYSDNLIDYLKKKIISTGNYLSYDSNMKKKTSRKKKWSPIKLTTSNFSKASGERMAVDVTTVA